MKTDRRKSPRQAYFSQDTFKFLRGLKRNNERAWFLAHKGNYEEFVRQPMLRFIADLAPRMADVDRGIKVDPRPVGGSMFRIYRDVRFSSDKSPYKTNVGAWFPLFGYGRDVHVPGFYIHISPTECFFGAGIWHPDGKTTGMIRAHILRHSEEWRALKRKMAVEGDKLKRPPKGFDPEHPLIEDLKLKDFLTSKDMRPQDVVGANILSEYVKFTRKARPLVRFLASALGLG